MTETQGKSSDPGTKHKCKWSGCRDRGPYSSVQELAKHLECEHLPVFSTQEVVYCLWEGCKVYNHPCQNKMWLSRHVKIHTKERPFKCIMSGCEKTFCTPDALNNHVQLHFQGEVRYQPSKEKKKRKNGFRGDPPTGHNKLSPPPLLFVSDENGLPPPPKKVCGAGHTASDDDSSSQAQPENRRTERKRPPVPPPPPKKMCSVLHMASDDDSSSQSQVENRKAKRKKQLALRIRIPLHSSIKLTSSVSRTSSLPIPLNGGHVHSDVLDHNTMSVISGTVVQLAHHSLRSRRCENTESIRLTAKVIGKRTTRNSDTPDVLVRWYPRSFLADRWVPIKDFTDHIVLPLNKMNSRQKILIATACSGHRLQTQRSRKRTLF